MLVPHRYAQTVAAFGWNIVGTSAFSLEGWTVIRYVRENAGCVGVLDGGAWSEEVWGGIENENLTFMLNFIMMESMKVKKAYGGMKEYGFKNEVIESESDSNKQIFKFDSPT